MGNMFKTDFQDSVCEVTSSSGAKLETDAVAQLAFRANKIWQKRYVAQKGHCTADRSPESRGHRKQAPLSPRDNPAIGNWSFSRTSPY